MKHTTSSGTIITNNKDRTVTIQQTNHPHSKEITLTDTAYRELVMHGFATLSTGSHTYPEA